MKTITFLAAALIFSPLAASASAVTVSQKIEKQWTVTFEQMIEVHQAIKSITKEDGSAKKGSEQAVKVLTQRFKELRAALTATDVKSIQARTSKSIAQGKLKAGKSAANGPGWSSIDGKTQWTDEADFKSSLGGNGGSEPPASIRESQRNPEGKFYDEADFKESISGGPYKGDQSKKKKKKKRVEHVEIEEQPVGKGYWENPDDWKSGF